MAQRVLVVDDSPTIRKVVASILEKHAYESVLASDGQDALEKLDENEIDLVLLDFVMPRMNGYQFCRELRTREDDKRLPIVLMSAKGDKIRGQFVRQTGAIDAITKPFDPQGLIAVIEAALKKSEEGRGRPAEELAPIPEDEDTVADSSPPQSVRLSDDPGLRRVQAAREFASAVAKVVVPSLAAVPSTPPDATTRFTEAIQRAITPSDMLNLSAVLKSLDHGDGTRDVLAGDVAVVSIAEVLQLLQLQRQTGALVITTRSAAEITLWVREGNLELARAAGLREEFRLGRYLVENAVLTREELETFLKNRAGLKRIIGEALVTLGMATDDQINLALTRQTQELVYEVVRWKSGRFAFSVSAKSAEADAAALGLAISAIVMEGFRRVDEWRLIEGSFDFEEVLFPDQMAISRIGDTKLTVKEREVLDLIDGERTVREIIGAAKGSAFDLSKIVYQLLNSRLVLKERGVTTGVPGIVVQRDGELLFLPANVAEQMIRAPVVTPVPGAALGITLVDARVVPVVALGVGDRELVLCRLDGELVAVTGLDIVDVGTFDESTGGVLVDGRRVPTLDLTAAVRSAVVDSGSGGA